MIIFYSGIVNGKEIPERYKHGKICGMTTFFDCHKSGKPKQALKQLLRERKKNDRNKQKQAAKRT